jgi:hypothetical protein
MNEVQDMREAMDRMEKNLDRFRWLVLHPTEASKLFTTYVLSTPEDLCKEIDRARNG